MFSKREPILRCSFCNKKQADVKKLVAGPNVYICDECVDICNDIVSEAGVPPNDPSSARQRGVSIVEEHLRTARVLLAAGDFTAAAREVRNAASMALRALLLLGGVRPDRWSSILMPDEEVEKWKKDKIFTEALHLHPELSVALHDRDSSHLLLRLTLEHAILHASDVESAIAATSELLSVLQTKADSALTSQDKIPNA